MLFYESIFLILKGAIMSEKENDILETSMEKETVVQSPASVSDDAKMNVIIGWGLYAVGLFTGILFIAAFIWALIKKDPENSEFERTHYKAMTSMFLWSLGLCVLGVITYIFIIGVFIILGVYVWNIFRIINGLVKATDRKPYPIKK